MEKDNDRVITGKMSLRQRRVSEKANITLTKQKQRYRIPILLSAAFVLSAVGAWHLRDGAPAEAVMSHLTAGFEYDDNLGRLQFVSNILPESAMVFLQSDFDSGVFERPANAEIVHAWTEDEPWIEYEGRGALYASASGEVMTVVADRRGEYTVRILHDNGYETVYSGLSDIDVDEGGMVFAGQEIGSSAYSAAYELRKDGLSIQPVFSEKVVP